MIEEGVERRQRRTDVAQQRHPRLDRVGDRTDRLDRFRPDRTVIARIGRVERRLPLRMRGPIEIAAVDDQPADGVAMAAEIFGRRVDDDRSAVLERPQEERRCSIVDDERDAERPADRRHFGNRENRQLRVRKRFGVVGACPVVGRAQEVLRVDRIDEANFDSLILERVGEQIPRAAVKIGRAHDIVAGLCKILQRECRRCLA